MAVVTIFVSNMDRAVQFYTGILGMKSMYRFGDEWTTLKTDDGLTVGLHPASKRLARRDTGFNHDGFRGVRAHRSKL